MPAARELHPTQSLACYIGHKIRREREARGWRQEDLATRVFVSRVRVTKVELGTEPPNPMLASRFDKVFGLDDDLQNLATVLGNSAMRDYSKAYLARQIEALTLHDFSILIPGLLQTEEYARALMLAGHAGDHPKIEQYVEHRVGRQQIWQRKSPPWLWLLLDEAVLRRVTGSRAIMREQLAKLREMSERPQINVQILPENTTAIPGSISLLTMENGDRGAYTEGFWTGAYTEDPCEIAKFQRTYDGLHANALSTKASIELIEKAIEGYS